MIHSMHQKIIFRAICLIVFCTLIGIPAVSAVTLTPGSSATATISQGDPVYIRGVATGQPQVGLQVWFIGTNFAKVTTVQVNDDDTYEYELSSSDTANLAPGQYFVLVQHPMMNGRFDVVYDASTGTVSNVETGKTLYRFTGSGSLQSTNSATALMQAVGSQNIDDTFASVSFTVGSPTAAINPIGDRSVGEYFTISGSTNLAVGDKILVEITSSSFYPTTKTQSSGFSGASGVVTVVAGSGGMNTWSFDVDTSTFTPDEYIVKISGMEVDMTASAYFNVLCAGSGDSGTCGIPAIANTTAAVTATGNLTATATPNTTASLPPSTVPATTQKSPLPAILGIAGLGMALVLGRKK